MGIANNKSYTWSLTIEQIIGKLKYNEEHHMGDNITILRQGHWTIMLTNICSAKNEKVFYVMKHNGKVADLSQTGYVQLYKQDGHFGTLSMVELPKFVTKKIVSVANALEKRGYNLEIKQNLFTR